MSKLASSFSRHEYKPRKRIRSVRSRLPLALPNADVFDEVASFLNVQESCGFVRTERAAHTCIAPILQKRAALYSPTKPTFHDLALVRTLCQFIDLHAERPPVGRFIRLIEFVFRARPYRITPTTPCRACCYCYYPLCRISPFVPLPTLPASPHRCWFSVVPFATTTTAAST